MLNLRIIIVMHEWQSMTMASLFGILKTILITDLFQFYNVSLTSMNGLDLADHELLFHHNKVGYSAPKFSMFDLCFSFYYLLSALKCCFIDTTDCIFSRRTSVFVSTFGTSRISHHQYLMMPYHQIIYVESNLTN